MLWRRKAGATTFLVSAVRNFVTFVGTSGVNANVKSLGASMLCDTTVPMHPPCSTSARFAGNPTHRERRCAHIGERAA